MNLKGPWIAKEILKKKKKAGSPTHLDFKTYYKTTIIKTVWYWHKDRHIDQWDRIENPEVKPCVCGQIIFNKDAKTTQWGKYSIFNKWCWETGYPRAKEWSWPLPYTINSERIKDLNVRPKIIKLLEENTEEIFMTLSLLMTSWMWHQKHRQQRQTQTTGTSSNLRTSLHQRTQSIEYEDQLWNGRKYLQFPSDLISFFFLLLTVCQPLWHPCCSLNTPSTLLL